MFINVSEKSICCFSKRIIIKIWFERWVYIGSMSHGELKKMWNKELKRCIFWNNLTLGEEKARLEFEVLTPK